MDMEEACKLVVIGAGGAATVVLTPTIIATLGFTSGGIVAGSVAAKMMAYFAVANGGGVAAGGLVALLQSLGGLVSWFSTGGTVGWLLSAICNQTGTH